MSYRLGKTFQHDNMIQRQYITISFSLFFVLRLLDVESAIALLTKPSFHRNTEIMVLSLKQYTETPDSRVRDIRFCSPLLEEGYPPAVEEYEDGTLSKKPLLLYLPGFDGTYLAPFLQLPEISTLFDVRCLTMSMKDRSTYEELKAAVLAYINEETQSTLVEGPEENPGNKFLSMVNVKPKSQTRAVYLVGESFGGILASDVALFMLEDDRLKANVQGIVLINAATCYDRSKLASTGPTVANLPKMLYPFGLLSLLPLFADEYSIASLLLILQAKALPSVINSAQREAYMGRIAFSLFQKLQYMPQETLKWRLFEWLETGCANMGIRLERFKTSFPSFRVLIIAGEADLCLPSIGEAERLSSLFSNPHVFVVEGAGHASTSGSRVNLAALMLRRFPEVNLVANVTVGNWILEGNGPYLGMVPRYDGRSDMGLSPLKYWNHDNYRPLSRKRKA
jgi:pimeloyl-ACP methyl ester carboxylesterase